MTNDILPDRASSRARRRNRASNQQDLSDGATNQQDLSDVRRAIKRVEDEATREALLAIVESLDDDRGSGRGQPDRR